MHPDAGAVCDSVYGVLLPAFRQQGFNLCPGIAYIQALHPQIQGHELPLPNVLMQKLGN